MLRSQDDQMEGLRKITMEPEKDEELPHRVIIRIAKLLARLRAVVPTWETRDTLGSEYAYGLAKIEDPSRAITQLRNLAKGHAISKGRKYITLDDIPLIIHTALSTATAERVSMFDLLIANNGVLSTPQICDFLNTTKPPALTELKATGLVSMDSGDPHTPSKITLKPGFDWFLSYQFQELKRRKEKCPPQEGSVISHNDLSRNDIGIGVVGNSGCCKVDHNILSKNRFFGVVVQDGEHTISNTKISGGNVGVAAIAFSVDTVATLDRVIIIGTTTPTQELPVGASAEVVFAPRSVQTAQATTLTSNPISFVLPTPAFADLSS